MADSVTFDPTTAVPVGVDQSQGFDPASARPEGDALADEARQHISAYRSGEIGMSPNELVQANLLAQQGKGAIQRFWDKASAIPDQIGKAAPQIAQGVKQAVVDEYNRDSAMSPLDRIKYGAMIPYNMGIAGAGAIVKAIPSTVETVADAARVLDPMTTAKDLLLPQQAQQEQAQQNALTDAATHYTNVGTDAAVKASGADVTSLPAKVAEQVAPLAAMGAIPMGEAGALEGGVASLSKNIVRGTDVAGAVAQRTAAQVGKAAAPLVKPAASAVGGAVLGGSVGHSLVTELGGALAGWTLGGGRTGKVIEPLLKAKFQDVIDSANQIIASPDMSEKLRLVAGNEVDRLNARIGSLRQGLKPEELAKLDETRSGQFIHDTDYFKGDAKAIREAQDEISDLNSKMAAINKRAKFEQFQQDAAEYATGLGVNTAIGGGIGAGFAGATSPPGDTSQMGASTLIGAGLGFGGGVFGVPKGMQALRAEKNAKVLNDIGAKVAPQDAGLNPQAQQTINRLAAVMDPLGGKVEIHSPEEYAQRPEILQAPKEGEPAKVVQAPNGHFDPDTDTLHLNRDALNAGTGVGEHEYTHFLQKLYGRALFKDAPPELTKQFDDQYEKALSKSGAEGHKTADERDAEVGRILLQNSPIENFYGGKRIFDTLDPTNILNMIGSKLIPDYKVDSTLGAPYNRADIETMKRRMFEVGDIAAKTRSNSSPQTRGEAPQRPDLGGATLTRPPIPTQQDASSAIPAVTAETPPDAIDAMVALGEPKATAKARADAAVQDLLKEGKPITTEAVVARAAQRSVPQPIEQGLSNARITPETPSPSTPTSPTERGMADVVPQTAEQATTPDYAAIRSAAEEAKRTELAGTKRKTKDAEIERAGLEAMAKEHAKTSDKDSVTFRTSRFGRESISGRKLDPNDPFHQYLIQQAGLSPENVAKMNFMSQNIGNAISADYLHAPEESAASGVTRKSEQAESTAPDRVAGEAATRRLSKSLVPTGFTYNIPSKTFEANVFSPDKFLNNVDMLTQWAKTKGLKGWKSVNDPQLVEDFNAMVANHKNGYTMSGKPIEGTPMTSVKPNPDFKPTVIPKDRADLLNAALGNDGAKVGVRKASPEKADKQILAQQNSPYWEPTTGETNRIRGMLGDEAKLLESTSETLRPELLDNLRTDSISDEATLRPSGFKGDRGAFTEQGTPRGDFSAAGFMPNTRDEGPIKPVEQMDENEMRSHINSIKPDIAAKAQDVYNSWTQNSEGVDEELGSGGICDQISREISDELSAKGYDIVDGGQEGDDHAFVIAHNGQHAFIVDIPPSVYESGGGYSWTKKEGVKFSSGHIVVEPIDIGDVLSPEDLAHYKKEHDLISAESLSEKLPTISDKIPANLKDTATKLGLRYDGPSLGGKAHQFTRMEKGKETSIDVPKDATPQELEQAFGQSPKSFMPAAPMYSQLERTIDSQPDKASPEQLRAAIMKGPGVKQAELRETKDTLGTSFEQWLRDNPKATKGQMLDFVRENQVQVKEKTLGGPGEMTDAMKAYIHDTASGKTPETADDWRELRASAERIAEQWRKNGDEELKNKYLRLATEADWHAQQPNVGEPATGEGRTKFSQYQLPGGHDYGETLATLPTKPHSIDQWKVLRQDGHVDGTYTSKEQAGYRAQEIGGTVEQGDSIRDLTGGPENFHSGHWDEPNVVLHLRHNMRDLPNGEKLLLLEENQSDWGQSLRRQDTHNAQQIDTHFDDILAKMKNDGILKIVC